MEVVDEVLYGDNAKVEEVDIDDDLSEYDAVEMMLAV